MFFSFVTALLRIIRIESSLMGAAIVFFFDYSYSHSLIMFCFLAFSFSFNDIMDYITKKDFDCHPSRPLPSGKVGLRAAIFVSALLFLLELIGIFQIRSEIMFLAFAILASYSLFLKRYLPAMATLLWCIAVALVVLWSTDSDIYMYLLFVAFFYTRELLLDFRDRESDA